MLWFAYLDSQQATLAVADYVNKFVKPLFAATPGVAKIIMGPDYTYAMRIWLDPSKMAARSVTVKDVQQVLRAQNLSVPTGQLRGDKVFYSIVTDLHLHSAQQFGNLVVRDANNHVVRLRDIAEVKVGQTEKQHVFLVGGKPGVAIGLIPEPGANSLDMTNRALALSRQIAAHLPPGMKQIIEFNQSTFTRASIHSVIEAIVEAVILVLLVVMAFLANWRAAAVPVVTIPICLLGSFALMWMLGFTINTVTLLALVLAIGLVVDDAIVVLENCMRYIEQGESRVQAAIKGCQQIGFIVLVMTLTLAAVYIPVGFASGVSGVFFREFAFTLLGAVLLSGFVALTLSPMMCSKVLAAHRPGRYAQWVDRQFARLCVGYQKALVWLMRKTVWMVIAMVVVLASGWGAYRLLPKMLEPALNMPMVNVWGYLPANSSFEAGQRYVKAFDKVLDSTPDVSVYLMQMWQPNMIYAATKLVPWQQRHHTSQEIAQQIQQQLSDLPGVRVAVMSESPPLDAFATNTGVAGDVQLNLMTTGSYRHLHQVMQMFVKAAQSYPGLSQIDSTLKWNTEQIHVHIRRDLAADLNVPLSSITSTLQTMLGGHIDRKQYQFGSQSYDVILQLPFAKLKSLTLLQQLYVRSTRGKMIPLSSVVTVSKTSAPFAYPHFQRLRADTFTAQLQPGYDMGQAVAYLQSLAKQVLPANVTYHFVGKAGQYLQSAQSMAWLFVMAIIFIYLVLAAQFESFLDPLIILVCVPFAVIGALWVLWLTGNSLNLYSEIGLITLIGLIAKHGVFITEFANQQLAQGKPIMDAVLQGALTRLRPILMTTAAMVLGAFPLALAYGPGAANRAQIGWVIVGGLLLGTVMALFVVPFAYVWIKTVLMRGSHKD